jgi:hypothetical protein
MLRTIWKEILLLFISLLTLLFPRDSAFKVM